MTTRELVSRFWRVLIPTGLQVAGCIALAALVLTIIELSALLGRFNADPVFFTALNNTFHHYLGGIIGYAITGQLVVIGFWSTIGLVVYLITWWARNLAISSRNEVILHTAYENIGSSRPELIHLIIKVVAGGLCVVSLAALPYGLHGWLALWQPLLHDPLGPGPFVGVVSSIIGFGVELYISLILFQLSVTPWYLRDAFTA